MKRNLNLLILTLGISASAMAGTAAGNASQSASFFLGGCGLIVVTLVRLTLKTRKIGK